MQTSTLTCKPLKPNTTFVMGIISLILWIVCPLWLFLWIWKKFSAPFRWLSDYEDTLPPTDNGYEPDDTDEQLPNVYNIENEDDITYEWQQKNLGA